MGIALNVYGHILYIKKRRKKQPNLRVRARALPEGKRAERFAQSHEETMEERFAQSHEETMPLRWLKRIRAATSQAHICVKSVQKIQLWE